MGGPTPPIVIGFGSDADEGSTMNRLAQIIEMLRKALFGVIYVMSKETSSSMFIILSGSFMQFFQVLGFAFNRDRHFPLNEAAAAPLLEALPYSTLAGWQGSSAPVKGGLTFGAAMTTVAIVLACVVYVGYSFVQNYFKYMLPLHILRQFAVLITSIGFIPIANVFIMNIQCDLDPSVSCYTGRDNLSLAFLLPVSILFVMFCFIVQLTYFEDDPCKPSVMGRSHSRAEAVQLMMRFLLTAFWQLLPDQSSNMFVILSMVVLTSVSAFAYTWYLPFYKFTVCQVKATLAWLQCWGAVVVAVAVFNNDAADASPVIAFYIGTPIVIIVSNLLLTTRKIWISESPVSRLSSPIEVQLKVHFLMCNVADAWQDNGREDRRLLLADEFERVSALAEEIYVEGIKRFSGSSMMFLFRGQFYLTVLKHGHIGMRSLAKAAERSPQLDEQFLIYRRRKKKSEENTGSSGSDIITAIAYEQNLKDAIDNDAKAAKEQVSFWESISSSSTKVEDLYQMTSQVSKFINLAQQNYNKIVTMPQRTPAALRVYAGFLIDALNERDKGQTILNQADEQAAAANKNANNVEQAQNDMSVRNGMVVISVDYASLGIITKVNNLLCNILGYERNDLIGKHVDTLVSLPWATTHHSMIQAFLDSGNMRLTKTVRHVFAKHRNGCIVPGRILLHEVSDEGNMLEFMATFSADEPDPVVDTNYLIARIDRDEAFPVVERTNGCHLLFTLDDRPTPQSVPFIAGLHDMLHMTVQFSGTTIGSPDLVPRYVADGTGSYNVQCSAEQRTHDGVLYDVVKIVSPRTMRLETLTMRLAAALLTKPVVDDRQIDDVRRDLLDDVTPAERDVIRSDVSQLCHKDAIALRLLQTFFSENALIVTDDDSDVDQEDDAGHVHETNIDAEQTTDNESASTSEASSDKATVDQHGGGPGGTTSIDEIGTQLVRQMASGPSGKSAMAGRARWLRGLFALVIVTAFCGVLTSFLVMNNILNNYQNTNDLLVFASTTTYQAMSIAYAAQWLMVISAGVDTADDEPIARSILLDASQQLVSFAQAIQANPSQVSATFSQMMASPIVNLAVTVGSGIQYEHVTLSDATARLAEAGAQLYATPLTNIYTSTNISQDAMFIAYLNRGNLTAQMNRSTSAWRDEVIRGLNSVQTTNAIVAIVPGVLIVLLIVVFVHPSLSEMIASQVNRLSVFTKVPPREVELLRKGCVKRLKDLRVARNELFAISDDDEESAIDAGKDIARSVEDLASDSYSRNKHTLLANRKQRSRLGWKVLLQLNAALFVYVAFVVVIFATIGVQVILGEMSAAVSTSTWGEYRRMKLRQTLGDLNQWAAPVSAISVNRSFDQAMSSIDELMSIEHGLTYGSSAMGTPGVLSGAAFTDPEPALMFTNGCVPDAAYDADCAVFDHSVLGNGLHVAIMEFAGNARSQIAMFQRLPANTSRVKSQRFSGLATMRSLETMYLQYALTYDLDIVKQQIAGQISVFRSAYLAVTLVFLSILVLLMAFLYEPMVRGLDLQAKHMRTMLLCIPGRVLQRIPDVASLLDVE